MASEAETEKKTAAVEAPTGDADIDKEDGWVREIRRREVQERTEGGGISLVTGWNKEVTLMTLPLMSAVELSFIFEVEMGNICGKVY